MISLDSLCLQLSDVNQTEVTTPTFQATGGELRRDHLPVSESKAGLPKVNPI